jgi:hypothetical protein
MSWERRWEKAALYGFYKLGMQEAERLDRALIHFAATGRARRGG